MKCHVKCFGNCKSIEICPFCQENLKDMDEEEKCAHMSVHKTLGHKELSIKFESGSFAKTRLPLLLKRHFGPKSDL